MARNRVKGITVEIGGDLTKLDKAFQGTNKYISDTTSKLKDVNQLLKFDPKNVELLDQKQRLLAQAVEGTAEKYENLDKVLKSSTVSNVKYAEWEKALASFQRQMTTAANEVAKFEKAAKDLEALGFAPDSSEVKEFTDMAEKSRKKLEDLRQASIDTYDALGRPISIDQHDALQRELSESKIKAEEAQKAFDNFSPTASRFASAADTISDKAGKIASATKGVSLAAGGLLTGMLGSVKGTEEFRTNLSKLETNANLAGVSMEFIDGALKELNRVSSDSDSNIETLSNLLQSGADESTLQQAVEALAGTVEQFPQTLTLESLADGLQETLATGEATGQFAEALDRLGIGAEKFSKQLSQVPGEADKLHFALDTLTNQGLADVHRAWVEEHGDLVENKDATYEFQQSLAELGEEMQPLMTTITKLSSSFLDWFNGLSDGKQNAIVALIALVAAISPVAGAISSVSRAVGDVTRNWGEVKKAASGVAGFLSGGPILVAVLGIAAAVALIALNWDDVKEFAAKTWDAIIEKSGAALKKADDFFLALGGENWKKLKESVKGVINDIIGYIGDAVDAVRNFWSLLFGKKDSGDVQISIGGSTRSGGGISRQSAAPLAMSGDILDNYPHFASGGLFAPNNPMLGVLGDHKTEYEVAAPESVIESSVQKALLTSGLGGGQKTVVDVHFSGTLAPLIRQLHPLITAETTRLGPAMAPRR